MAQDGRHFAEDLGELKTRLLVMGRLAEERVSAAVEALIARDTRLIRDVVSGDSPIDMAWASRCVADCVDDNTIVLNEYDLDSSQTRMRVPGSYFGSSPAGGLGWALGAALGARLAAPGKTVISCMGDGTYIFGCPTHSAGLP